MSVLDFLWLVPVLPFLGAALNGALSRRISKPAVNVIALGAPLEMIALWSIFSAVHGVFQHANLPLRLGPLNWVFSMAELHRWHHSPRVEEANSNYGQNIILYDILFGTRYLPEDREPPEQLGIESMPRFPMTWWQQVLSPFRWQQVKAESAAPE